MGARFTPLMLKQAGFNDTQVVDWIDNQRQYLKTAGFSDFDINEAYGLKQQNSKAITSKDMSSSVSDVFPQHQELGKNTALENKTNKQNENIINTNLINDNHNKNIDGTNYNNLIEAEQDQISLMYENAKTLFKDNDEGKVGYVNEWFDKNLPNVDKESTKFLDDSDLTVIETLLNEDQKKMLENMEARDILEGNVGYNTDKQKYTIPPNEFQKIETEKLLKKEEERLVKKQEKEATVKILNTNTTTGEATMPVLLQTKNDFNVNDWDVMFGNEVISMFSALESDNRNIKNENSSAAGYFQLTKDTMSRALTSYGNRMHKNDKSYMTEDWVKEAYEHMDMMKLTDDQQRALALVHLLERKGSDELWKKILVDKDKEAVKELYKVHHKTGEISEALNDRINEYVDTLGTDKYIYQNGQLPFLPSDNIITKTLSAIPKVGDNIVKALGGQGTYSVFTNGYNLSVNGFIDNFHKNFVQKLETGEVKPEDVQEIYRKTFMNQEQTFSREIIQSVVTLANDLPWMIGGCFAASGAATAATGGLGAVAAPVVCGAGAFAAPEVIRDSYMRAIESGEVANFKQFLKHFFTAKTAVTGTKAAVIGGATLGVGSKVTKVLGPRLGPTLTGKAGTTAARLGAEITTMVTLGALLEGQIPTKNDFAHATVLIFGLHGAMRSVGALKNIYRKYSIHPKEMVTLALADHTVLESLRKGEVPDVILNADKKIIKGMEKTADIKLLPAPKYKLNEDVHISSHGADTGKIVAKEAIGSDLILVVRKPNGETVQVLESEVRKIDVVEKEVVINKNNKIEIKETKKNDFIEKQESGQFEADIIELVKLDKETAPKYKLTGKEGDIVNKDGTTYKANPAETLKELGDREKVETIDKTVVSDGHILIEKYFYPKMAKYFDTLKNEKLAYKGMFKTGKEIKGKLFKGLTEQHKKIDVMFAIKKGSLSKTDVLVGRVGNTFVQFNRKAYQILSKFTDKDSNVRKAKLLATENSKFGTQLVFLHPESNRPIGLLMSQKLDPRIENQAKNYWREYSSKDKTEGFYYDRSNSTRDGNTFEVPPDPYSKSDSYAGNKEMPWQRIYNDAKGLDLFDLVDLVRVFIDKSPELKKLSPTLRGYFQFKGKNAPKIAIAKSLQKSPASLYMTLAHEIGHLIDYLPEASLKRGNILGSLATMKKFMNEWIDGKNNGAKPLSKKEINELKKLSEKYSKRKEKETNEEIKKLEITPETILQIFQDANARKNINPLFYEAFVKLSDSLKKLVVKDAMKGLMSNHLKVIADKINGKKVDPKLNEEANKLFKALFEREIQDRGLVNNEIIMTELRKLTMQWKPFDATRTDIDGVNYKKYRYSPRELFADYMMAWLLKPQWVKLNAPRTFDMWIHHIDRKPEVKRLYEDMQIDLNSKGSTRIDKLINEGIKESRDANVAKMKVIEEEYKVDKFDQLGAEVYDSMTWFYRRIGDSWNRWHSPSAKEANINIERYRYRASKLKLYSDTLNSEVNNPIVNLGYNLHEFGFGLKLRNLYESKQREGMVTGGYFKLNEVLQKELEGKFDVRTIEQAWEKYQEAYPDLIPLMKKFSDIRQQYVVGELAESGMYDAAFIEQLRDNTTYVKYDVLKHLLTRLEKYGENASATSFIGKSQGTFSMTRNPFEATVETDMVLIIEARRHKAMSSLVQWLKENKKDLENRKGLWNWSGSKTDRVIMKPKSIGKNKFEKPPKDMVPFHYMKNGELQTYYINKWAAGLFNGSPLTSGLTTRALSISGEIMRKAFTEYNPAFWPVDLVRDSNRTVVMLEGASYLDIKGKGKHSYLKYLYKSVKPAYSSIFKNGTPLTRMMEDESMLISSIEGYRGQAGQKATRLGIDEDTFMLEQLMKRWNDGKGKVKKWDEKTQSYKEIQGTFHELYDEIFGVNGFFGFLGDNARAIARMPKIASAMYIKDAIKRGEIKMTTKEMGLRIQGDYGHPSFLRQGNYNQVTNNAFLYLNAFKEGWRSTLTRFVESPWSVGAKFLSYNVLPKFLQKAMEVGAFGAPVAAFYYGVNKWDRDNYIIVPLGYDDEGRSIYLRIPQDESARVLTSTMYKIMSINDDKQLMGEPDGAGEMAAFLGTSGLPNINPVVSAVADLITWMSGKTPHDDFRGTSAIDQTLDKAGGWKRDVEIAKWFMNSYTGQGFYKFKKRDLVGVQTELEEVLGYPIVGTVLGRFVKIGTHPAKTAMNSYVKDYDKTMANITIDAKDALAYIINGESEKLEAKHLEALKLRKDSLKSNPLLLELLAKTTGGNVLLQEFVAETDKKKQAMMMLGLIDFIRKTDNKVNLNFKKKTKGDKVEE